MRDLEAEAINQGVELPDDGENLVEAKDCRETLERIRMVRVALNPSNQRLYVVWILLDVFIAHLLQAPLGELCHSVAAHLPQGRIVSARGTLN